MEDKIKHYESAGHFVQDVKNKPEKTGWNLAGQFSDDWAGGSIEQAYNLAENGWPEGLKMLTQKIGVHKNQERGKTRINDVAGDFPNVARYLSSAPDCMTRRVVRESNRKPILDIFINPTGHGSADKSCFFNLGAATAMLIDSLEQGGYSTCLTIAHVSKSQRGTKETFGVFFPIKRDGEVLDLERIIYFIAHPSFLRRLTFRHSAQMFEFKNLGYGMGSCEENETVKKYVPANTIVISPAVEIERCNTVDKAIAFLRSMIKEQRPDLLEDMERAA